MWKLLFAFIGWKPIDIISYAISTRHGSLNADPLLGEQYKCYNTLAISLRNSESSISYFSLCHLSLAFEVMSGPGRGRRLNGACRFFNIAQI